MMASWDSLMLTWVTCGICITSDVILISLFHLFTFPVSLFPKRFSRGPTKVALQVAAWLGRLHRQIPWDHFPRVNLDATSNQISSDLDCLSTSQIFWLKATSKQPAKVWTKWWLTSFFLELLKESRVRYGERAPGREQLLQVGVHCCACWRLWCSAPRNLLLTRGVRIPTSLHQR